MKRDGLVDVEPNGTNKRYVNITITKKDREKLAQAEPVAEEITSQMMSNIRKAGTASMNKFLNTLKQNAIDGINKSSRFPRF